MKIYTKTGDAGQTGLLGGSRVSKSHVRIEAYGTLDELNAWIGLLADENPEEKSRAFLHQIQNDIFLMGSHLAAENEKGRGYLNPIREALLGELESEIDRMTEMLPPLRNFVLPGGHQVVSHIHIARTICRRAERIAVHLHSVDPVDERIIKMLNRLSDYLFTLSRMSCKLLKVEEKTWKSK
ncbi:MAG: cob(I)yrinic acid a,c-diamide adenosyltransferase [Cryomorphaceae bacterium]|nr:cob(I)yrinic acid a,c-diamide adenosyltransferase [Cryomorphaceae bacterium]